MKDISRFGALILVVGGLNLWLDDRFFVRVLTLTVVWAIAGVAWNLTAKAGQISLGHSAFVGIGAYTFTYLLHTEAAISPWIGMIVGMILAVLLAVVVGVPTFRLQGFYFTLATIAFPLILELLISHFGDPELTVPYHPENEWLYLEFRNAHTYIWLGLGFLLLALIISTLIDRSMFGYALQSIRDNEVLARAVGIQTTRWKLAAFAISAALSAVMAVLWVKAILRVTTAEGTFGVTVVIVMLSVAFVGGVGKTWGPVVGAGLLIPLAAILDDSIGEIVPGAQELVYGGALVLVALFIPQGIVPFFEKFWQKDAEEKQPPRLLQNPSLPLWLLCPRGNPEQGEDSSSPIWGHHRGIIRLGGGPLETGTELLTVRGIAKSFGGFQVLRDVSFGVKAGQKVGMIGPNGAGKTTLFNIITAHLAADEGDILYKGQDISPLRAPNRYGLGISRTFQVPQGFHTMSPLENVLVAALGASRPAPIDESMTMLEKVGLAEKANRELSALTVAEFKQLELARAMISQPDLLLLDEPLAGLNAAERDRFFEILEEVAPDELGILIIEHSVRSLIQNVEWVVALDYGEIIADGEPDAVISNPRVLEAYLGKKWMANVANQ